MTLGQNIYELRRKSGLSQEQLGERITVTRQTISNWELDETSPNPEQLKMLSKELNVSIDDLLNNDIKNVIFDKVDKTEKNTKRMSKIIKYIAIGFVGLLIIDVITFIFFFVKKIGPFEEKEATPSYTIKEVI